MRILFIVLLSFLITQPCFALTDAEYTQLLQSSAKFREENAALGDQWESMKKSLKGEQWKKIVKAQQEWIAAGRDAAAKKNMAAGYTRAFAYAKATHDRCAELWAIEQNHNRTPQEKAEGYTYDADLYDEPHGSLYGALGDNMGYVVKIIPLAGKLAQIHVVDSYGHNHIYYFIRKSPAERQNVDNMDLEPEENNQIYAYEIIDKVPTPKSARDIGETRPTIEIIGKFNQAFG